MSRAPPNFRRPFLSSVAVSSRRSTMRRHIRTHQATHKHTQTNNNAHASRTRPRDPAGKSPVPASPQCKQNGGNCTRPTRGENVAATMLLTRSTSSGRRRRTPPCRFASRRGAGLWGRWAELQRGVRTRRCSRRRQDQKHHELPEASENFKFLWKENVLTAASSGETPKVFIINFKFLCN